MVKLFRTRSDKPGPLVFDVDQPVSPRPAWLTVALTPTTPTGHRPWSTSTTSSSGASGSTAASSSARWADGAREQQRIKPNAYELWQPVTVTMPPKRGKTPWSGPQPPRQKRAIIVDQEDAYTYTVRMLPSSLPHSHSQYYRFHWYRGA